MITREQIEKKFPNVALDKLSDETWNLLDSAMADNDWDTVNDTLQPYQDIATTPVENLKKDLLVQIDKEFLRDVLNFVKEMDAEKDAKGKETYIHKGLRLAIETGKYTGYEK